MQSADIAPDSASSLSPMHPGYAVVVARNEPQDIVADHLVLVRVHVVNSADMQAHAGEQGFPPGYGMRADNGMGRRKLVVDI